MMNKAFINLVIMALFGLHIQTKNISIQWKRLPNLSVGTNKTQGIAGAFAGTTDGILFVAGGCNFPNIPVVDGGTKVFYNSIYCLREDAHSDKTWRQCGKLPYPVAYGISITLPDGVLCIGGSNSKQKFSNAFLLKWDRHNQKPVIESYPSLPLSFDNMAGAKVGNFVYVAGGIANGAPCNLCFRLNLNNLKNGWQAVPAFPGEPRLQPVGVGQQMHGEDCFFLLGGFTPYSDSVKGKINTDGYVFIPSLNKWKKIKSPQISNQAISITGGVGMAFHNRYIICFGGVNKTIFNYGITTEHQLNIAKATQNDPAIKEFSLQLKNYFSHAVQWYKYNPDILIYDVKSKKWNCLGQSEHTARAGCSLIKENNNNFIIAGGELKPGVRSPDVYEGSLKE